MYSRGIVCHETTRCIVFNGVHDHDVGVRSPTKRDARENYMRIPEMYCFYRVIQGVSTNLISDKYLLELYIYIWLLLKPDYDYLPG